jgi:hypothetical protein
VSDTNITHDYIRLTYPICIFGRFVFDMSYQWVVADCGINAEDFRGNQIIFERGFKLLCYISRWLIKLQNPNLAELATKSIMSLMLCLTLLSICLGQCMDSSSAVVSICGSKCSSWQPWQDGIELKNLARVFHH